MSFESIVPRLDQYLDEWLWLTGIPPNQITPRHRDELRDLADTMVRRELDLALEDYRRHLGQIKIPEGLRTAWLCSRTNTYYPLVPYLKRISYDVDRKASGWMQ